MDAGSDTESHGHDSNGDNENAVPVLITDEYFSELQCKIHAVSYNICLYFYIKFSLNIFILFYRQQKVCRLIINTLQLRIYKSYLIFVQIYGSICKKNRNMENVLKMIMMLWMNELLILLKIQSLINRP